MAVRDGVANIVDQLQKRGFEPRRVGPASWEAHCPVHRGMEHALAISRNEFNHAALECRSAQNCQHIQIVRALGWTNDHLYDETPDSLLRRLSQVPIQPASFGSSGASGDSEAGTTAAEAATGSDGTPQSHARDPSRGLQAVRDGLPARQ